MEDQVELHTNLSLETQLRKSQDAKEVGRLWENNEARNSGTALAEIIAYIVGWY